MFAAKGFELLPCFSRALAGQAEHLPRKHTIVRSVRGGAPAFHPRGNVGSIRPNPVHPGSATSVDQSARPARTSSSLGPVMTIIAKASCMSIQLEAHREARSSKGWPNPRRRHFHSQPSPSRNVAVPSPTATTPSQCSVGGRHHVVVVVLSSGEKGRAVCGGEPKRADLVIVEAVQRCGHQCAGFITPSGVCSLCNSSIASMANA